MCCKGQTALEHEQREKHVKVLAKDLNTPEAEYPQPYFQGTSAKRSFILNTMSKVLSLAQRDLWESCAATGNCHIVQNLAHGIQLYEQPLLWLHSARMEGHIIAQKQWIMQDWVLTPAQCAAAFVVNKTMVPSMLKTSVGHLLHIRE